jgi:CHAT domain-containing protein/tetratricopeptide (TPR) repeat protein
MPFTMERGRLILFGLGILLLPADLSAAAESDPAALLRDADRLSDLFNWADAGPLYARAEKLFTAAGDERNMLYARYGRIRSSMETVNLPETSDYLGGQLRSPLLQKDLRLRLMCLIAKGDIDGEIDSEPASADWQEALAVAHTLEDKRWESRAPAELGFQQFLQGDTANAMKAVSTALMTAHDTRDVGAEIRYMAAIGTGLVLRQLDDQGISYLDRAIALASKYPDSGYPYVAVAGKIQALINKRDYKTALALINESESEARKKNKEIKLAQVLLFKADIALANHQQPEAIKILGNVADLTSRTQSRLYAESEIKLAGAFREQRNLKNAEEAARLAVTATGGSRDMYLAPARLRVLADVEEAVGHLDKAAQLYQRATDIIEGMLLTAPDNAARAALLAEMSPVFESRFRLAAERGNTAEAFQAIEQVRGRILAGSLWRPQPGAMADGETEDRIRKLKIELVRTDVPRRRRVLMDQLFFAEQARWTKISPGTAVRALDPSTEIGLAQVERELRRNEVLLEYVLGESESFCLAVSRYRTSIVRLPARNRIESLADAYMTRVKSSKLSETQAHLLFAALIQPLHLPAHLNSVIVVPDGILHLVPFSALQDGSGKYLVSLRTIWYEPSGGTLALMRRSKHTQARQLFMGVGGVNYGVAGGTTEMADARRGVERSDYYDLDLTKLQNLPGTQEEVETAANVLGAHDAELKVGTDGTETQFKSATPDQFRIIHLAVHGIANPKNPERAALIFRPDPPHDDGLLEPREILGLRLNADLVVLSACETAVGHLQGEEGIANLSRTFLAAGARSVISTLWKIDDTYSLFLMKRFYIHLREGKTEAAALGLSQIDLLNKFGIDTPTANWAAFTLLGDGDRVMFPSNGSEVGSR